MNETAVTEDLERILLVESDVMVRHALAEYLRHCGYRVIEAATTQEAMTLLRDASVPIDMVFSAVEIEGTADGFGLSKWVRENQPGVKVILAGTVVSAAHAAGDLCEEGPHLAKPYEPQQVVEWIKKLSHLKG
jgi:DNA-binding NtrC family response regulator